MGAALDKRLPAGVVDGREGAPDEFLRVREVAALLRCGYATVRALIDRRKLRALEVAPGHFRIRRRWVEEYVETCSE